MVPGMVPSRLKSYRKVLLSIALLVVARLAHNKLVALQARSGITLPPSPLKNNRISKEQEGGPRVGDSDPSYPTRTRQKQPAIVPHLPWEIESAASNRTCSPPADIPNTCCLGSLSKGKRVYFDPKACNSSGIYDRVQEYTLAYMERLPIPESFSDQTCDLCRIVDLVVANNLTLTFQGDSLTRQMFTGLECELRRRGYNVQGKEARWERPKKLSREEKIHYGITDTVKLMVSSPSPSSSSGVGRIQYYAVYRPFRDNVEVAEIVRNSDVVIFDHGLHFNPYKGRDFRNDMENMLQAYTLKGKTSNETKAQKSLRLLAWRETSAQHWNATGGHYSVRNVRQPYVCVPIANKKKAREGFRLPLLTAAAQSVGMKVLNALDSNFSSQPVNPDEMIVLPFREYTSELHYLHDSECTHYCTTPYLWLPIWRSLRLAMDRALPSST